MLRNLILSGGVAHDYATTSAMLADIVAEAGFESEIREDFDVVEDGSILAFDIVTLNCVRWTCSQKEVHPSWRAKWRFELSDAARRGFSDFLSRGKGLLAIHAAAICFDEWAEYPRILGGKWEWGISAHTPVQENRVEVLPTGHPIVEGLADFEIEDELYTDVAIAPSSRILIEADWEGRKHPLVWLNGYGKSRVCYNGFGHGAEAFRCPENRMLLQRSALWIARRLKDSAAN